MAESTQLSFDLIVTDKSSREIAEKVTHSLNNAAKEWKKDVRDQFAQGVDSGFKLAMGSGKSGNAIGKFLKTNITQVYSDFQKELNKGNIEAAEKLSRILEKRTKLFEREVQAQVDALEAVNKRALRTKAERADAFGSGVQNLSQAMQARDPSGYLGIGRQIGGRLQEAGRARQDRARNIREDGGDPDKAAKMAQRGKMMAVIGGSLATVAAMAGAVLMLIKLFMDLNDKIVDMNKSILQTGTVSDMGLGGRAWDAGRKFKLELEDMRESILASAKQLDGFRVSAEEMFGTLGALNEYGKGFEKIRYQIERGSKHLQNYGDAAENAVAYAKLMGMSSKEMGAAMSKWSNDFGQDLERVYQGLSAVRQEAMASGFSMKRFVGIIMEATSGMGAYSVRLEEAGKTLKFLSNILGETAGAELFKSLTNAFTEASTSDRLKRIFTTGTDEMTAIFKDQASADAAGIFKDLKSQGYEGKTESGEGLVEQMKGLSEQGRLEMMASMKSQGVEPELLQRLDNLVETVRAGQGDLAAQVNAMSTVGPAAALAALTQSKVFGGRMLHEFVAEEGAGGRAAAEQMTGKTGLSFEALVDASRGTASDMYQLRKIQNEVLNEGKKLTKAEQLAMAELYGATVTAEGNIVGATADVATGLVDMGEEITNEQGLMLAQNNRYKDAEEAAVSEDIKLAREIAQSTEKLANVMEANMLDVLNKIYKTIYNFWMDFLRMMPGFEEDPGRQARLGTSNRLVMDASSVEKELRQNEKIAEGLSKLIEETKDPIMKKGAEAQLEYLHKTDKTLNQMLEVNEMARDRLANMDTEGMTQAQVMKKIAGDLDKEGYSLGMSTVDQNASRLYTDKMNEDMDTIWAPMADKLGLTGAAASVGLTAAKTAGVGAAGETSVMAAARKAAELAQKEGVSSEEAFPQIQSAIDSTIHKLANESDLEGLMHAQQENIAAIANNTREAAQAAKDTGLALAGGEKVGDMILRPGSRPILTDPQDTLMAFKPGGPIAAGMGAGAGGGAPVTVNIYGGDEQKVYNQVMRVMKTLGHA